MQKAEVVLSMLSKRSGEDAEFIFERIYRNLFNPDFYIKAYCNICANDVNITPDMDKETKDYFNKDIIDKVIKEITSETYYPEPVRKISIPKKKSKLRYMEGTSLTDKLVQEVARMLLEAVFEPAFLDSSHGFRQNRSCQTALYQIKTMCRVTNWVIEGDIIGFFDNVDHEILINLIRKKINDGRFLELIRRFLKAGYFLFHKAYDTLSGIPQGGIISPILANIYLHELDKYMQAMNTVSNYTRAYYVRCADDFVVCLKGNKALAEMIRENIKCFLKEELRLELCLEKTAITNLNDENFSFLGYEIAKSRFDKVMVKNSTGMIKTGIHENIQLKIPEKVITKRLEPFMANKKSVHHSARIYLPVSVLLNEYNYEIQCLYNYYCLADDVSTKLGKFRYYHYYSLLKTLAAKEKCSIKRVLDKYGVDVKLKDGAATRKVAGVRYETKNGQNILTYFNESIKRVKLPKVDNTDSTIFKTPAQHQMIARNTANKCRNCSLISYRN